MKKVMVLLLLVTLLVSTVLLGEDIKRGGTLRITSMKQGVLVHNFNPFSPNSNEIAVGGFYETMIYYNPMTGKVMNWLAKDYKWSDDLKEITFSLRDDVKWNDGTAFTEKDVLFTLDLAKNSKALDVSGIWSMGLTEVVSETPYQVKFRFDRINTTLIERFSEIFIIPEHIWSSVSDPLTWNENYSPVGTGPFMYKEDSFTEQTFEVTRNPNYWQIAPDGKPLPYIDGMLYASTTNEQVGLKLARGEFDWAGYFVANIEDVYVKADPEHFKFWLPEGNMVFLNLSNLTEPFNNKNLRVAVAAAIDPEEITRIMASGAVPASVAGVKSNYLRLAEKGLDLYGIEYDPEYSMQVLEDEGYELNRDGIYEKDGKALSMPLYVPTGWTDWVTGAEEVSRELREAGIEAIVTQVAWPSPYKDMMYTGEYEMLFGISVTGSNPFYQFDNWLHSKHWAPLGERSNNYYGMKYKNAEIDKLLDSYTMQPDPEKQDEIMEEVITLYLKDLPSVPMFFNPVWFEYNTRNFVGWPNAENPYALPRPNAMHKMPVLLNVHLR